MKINTINKIWVSLIITFFVISCDPQEDRIIFFNNNNNSINVELINIQDSIISNILPCRVVKRNSEERFVKLFSWESEFDDIKPDTLIQVIIYKNFEKNICKFKDSLLNIGEYEYRSYSYKDLKKQGWKIKYPEDGFKKGFPLKHIDEQSDEKLLPSPHILKEKGIKDIWNKSDANEKR